MNWSSHRDGTTVFVDEQLLTGPLCFPVTPYDASGGVDEVRFRRHAAYQIEWNPGALFVACGTGEFLALTADEVERLARVAVDEAASRLPVFAGVGYGTAIAIEMTRRLEQAGVSGLLVFPPNPEAAWEAGVVEHYRRLAASTDLPLILYQRGATKFSPSAVGELAELENVIGIKDGIGDLEHVQRQRLVAGGRLEFFNGMPTAEMSMPAFRGIGIRLYSSAVFNFVPEIAQAFFHAIATSDDATVERLLDGFYRPLVDLRQQVPGYAVSLIRAGVTLRHGDVGPPRPPLPDVPPTHVAALSRIVDEGLDLL